jgi:hypothetical protein
MNAELINLKIRVATDGLLVIEISSPYNFSRIHLTCLCIADKKAS